MDRIHAERIHAERIHAERIHYSDLWQGIAREVPDRPAIVAGGETMTWGRFAAEAGALARYLTERGLKPGDAAATLLYNRPEFLTFMWACFAVGVSPVAINYRYKAPEIRALLLDSDARVLVVPASLAAVTGEAAAGLDLDLIAVHDGDGSIGTQYSDIVAAGGAMPATAPPGADLRLYTGGTTGAPKAVVWDLDSLLVARRASTWGLIGIEPPDTLAGAVAIAVDPANPATVTLPMSPLLHGTAQSMTLGTLAVGGTVVLQPSASVDVDDAYRLITDHAVTRVIVAGDALALPLADVAERHGGLPSVRWIYSSGMRFTDGVKRRLHDLGELTIIDMLAASEGGPFAFGITRSADDLPARLVMTPGAVLLDEEHRELEPTAGTLGILGFRGILPRGYYGDPQKTAETFLEIGEHRYIVPGDWARANGDGTIELLGRLSAVVNTGGEKVFPAEVEEVLLAHPDVADAVVFGLPHPRFGEAVSAMVAPVDGTTLDVDDLLDFVSDRLAGFKKPRHVFVRPSLERSQTGKVELARVKQDALAELESVAS
jgi:acyl-CoA synthetase (AMP-forming)/AMP-acid ligase II